MIWSHVFQISQHNLWDVVEILFQEVNELRAEPLQPEGRALGVLSPVTITNYIQLKMNKNWLASKLRFSIIGIIMLFTVAELFIESCY